MCPRLHTPNRRAPPSRIRPHRARETAAKTRTDCNAALHLATCAIILVAGLCLDARAADVRTKSGSKQPVFSPTGAKGAKLDKPLNADQIKKIVKKKLKQDHASINLFELILFRNRKVKETVPEKSCFKYNLAALGFALNSFADTINSCGVCELQECFASGGHILFQANGIRMPDVVKTKFHPPASERASFIEHLQASAGAPILMRVYDHGRLPEFQKRRCWLHMEKRYGMQLWSLEIIRQSTTLLANPERIKEFANALGRNDMRRSQPR